MKAMYIEFSKMVLQKNIARCISKYFNCILKYNSAIQVAISIRQENSFKLIQVDEYK